MASNEYHFITHWRVPATLDEVNEILKDPTVLPRWWPAVYLAVAVLEPGDEDHLGTVVDLHTKGWLPYTLRWQFRVTETHHPHGFSLQAWGDFEGRGIWRFVQDGDDVAVTYDWQVRAGKPLLRRLGFALRPVFEANHRWAMRQGEASLRRELARRRALSQAAGDQAAA